MAHKVTIIGAGSVGATTAYTMVTRGIASEIVLIDINKAKALGEAMDIDQGTPYCKPVKIYAGEYEDAVDSDIVVITSGMPRKPGQTRLELAQTNVDIIKDIANNIVKYAPNAIYIIVSNPVDVLTYAFIKYSGLPENQVMGTGTILDTSRLRAKIAELYKISPLNVHACVLGEHGDSSFIPWSVATVASVPIEKYWEAVAYKDTHSNKFDFDRMAESVKRSGGIIIERKGATYYAISTCICQICSCIFSGLDTTLTLSTMMHNEYGIDDVCISSLSIINSSGVSGKVNLTLTEEEIKKYRESAEKIKTVLNSINF